MARTAEESLRLFDHWAETYDQSVLTTGGPLEGYAFSLQTAAAMVPLAPGARVLDVGIGTGGFSALLEQRGARIWGVDISPKMLDRCRGAHPAFGLSQGSFLPIPHGNMEFDAVVASFAFHEVAAADRPAACRELLRVLRPGGAVCLLDIIFASAEAEAEAARLSGKSWDPTEEYARVGDLDRLLRQAGFTGIYWTQAGPMHWAVIARRPGDALLTDRLLLAPAPAGVLQALLDGKREEAEALLGAVIPGAWPTADVLDFLPEYVKGLAADPRQARWGARFMIDRQLGTVVGDLGLKGAPDEAGQVEIGYGVLPQFQRQGYAFEAAAAVVNWALQQPEVRGVLADCLEDNPGSIRVLQKLGMVETGRSDGLIHWRKERI